LTCFWTMASRSFGYLTICLFCEDVSRASMFISLFPYGLKGMLFQQWAEVIDYRGTELSHRIGLCFVTGKVFAEIRDVCDGSFADCIVLTK
jgi:hypothetical protein